MKAVIVYFMFCDLYMNKKDFHIHLVSRPRAPVCSGYKVPREAGWYAEKLYVMLPYQFLMSQYLIVHGFSVSESLSFTRANTYNKQRIFDFSV